MMMLYHTVTGSSVFIPNGFGYSGLVSHLGRPSLLWPHVDPNHHISEPGGMFVFVIFVSHFIFLCVKHFFDTQNVKRHLNMKGTLC